jgi:hypothetical protein
MACSVQGRQKKVGQVKREVKSISSFSLIPRGLFKKNSFWQAK